MHSSTLRISALAISLTGMLAASCSSDLREASGLRDLTLPLQGQRSHALCGWLYEHDIAADTELAYDTFAAHAADFDAVHPEWWHVAALIRLAVDNHYDGLDLDYEHIRGILATTLPKRTIAQEREAMSAFIEAVADALHAHGKELSLAVPTNFSKSSELDLEVLSRVVDEIHVMGYDFHYEEGDHPGPTAPLGWIQHFIDQVATLDGGQRSSRFILGLANYGIYGPPGGEPVQACESTARCVDLFDGDYATTTDELSECSGESADYAGRSPNVRLPDGKKLYFEDLASLEEKVAAAQAGGFGGITYRGIGGEPQTPGPLTFFAMVRSHFPAQASPSR